MSSFHFEIHIDRKPDEVWHYLADPANEVEWQDGVISSTVEPPGPVTPGTRKTKVRRTPLGDQRFVVEYTTMDHAQREWHDVVVEGSVKGSTGHYQVVPHGSGSKVTLDVVMRAQGVARLLMPVIDRTSKADLAGGLEHLKGILEPHVEPGRA